MKTAFVLLRTLGDVVLLNTLVNEYKKVKPEAIITVYINEAYHEIVAFNPNITETVCPPDLDFVLKEISDGRYDEVLFPYQTTPEDNYWHHLPEHKDQHLVDFYAKRCGITITDRRCYVYPFANELLDELKINWLDFKYITVHTKTLVESKNWDKFQELVDEIIYRGLRVIQLGGKTDKLLNHVIDARDIGINTSALVMQRSKFFIGLDSGLSYIADAMDIPTVVLMGMSIPLTSGPIGKNAIFITAECRPECNNQRCHSECKFKDPCIKKIQVKDVLDVLVQKNLL